MANWECANECANEIMQVWCLQDGYKYFYNAVFCNKAVILIPYSFLWNVIQFPRIKKKVNINSELYDSVHLFIHLKKKKRWWENLTVSISFSIFDHFYTFFPATFAAAIASFAFIFLDRHNRELLYRGDLFGACVRRHLAAWPDLIG